MRDSAAGAAAGDLQRRRPAPQGGYRAGTLERPGILLSGDSRSGSSSWPRLEPAMAINNRRALVLMSIRGAEHRAPLGQEIFDEIAIDFVEGRLCPGDTLNSVELARRFGTSRTPVREAIAELERQGVVVVPPRRRPYIAHATLKQMKDVYDLRASLFTLVSELIIDECPPEQIAELWQWQEALEDDTARGSADDYFWHNVGFRLCEIRLAGNEELQRVLGGFGLRTLHFRHLSLSQPERLKSSVEKHRNLLIAYEQGDKACAVEMTRGLIMAGYETLRRSGLISPTPPPLERAGRRRAVSTTGLEGPGTIDVHAHMVPTALFDAVRAGEFSDVSLADDDGRPFLVAGKDRLGPFGPGLTDVDQRLAWMDERGISEQWVSPWLDLFTWHRFSTAEARQWTAVVNHALFDLVERGAGRLRAVPTVHLASGQDAVSDTVAVVGHAAALLVNTQPAEIPSLSDPALAPFWEFLAEQGLPAILHPPVNGPSCSFTAPILQNVSGRLMDTTAAVLDIVVSGILERFPDLRLVAVHGGGLLPYQAFRLDGLQRAGLLAKTQLTVAPSVVLRRLFYDTAALDSLSVEFLVRRVGADHVLLGSDAPFAIGDPDPVGTVSATDLPEVAKLAICSNNAGVLAPLGRGHHAGAEMRRQL